ncbi:MAG: fibronectin type III domain-containing protein [Thermoplasmatota archaeon]
MQRSLGYLLVVLLLMSSLVVFSQNVQPVPVPSTRPQVQEDHGQTALEHISSDPYFIENRGQISSEDISFYSEGITRIGLGPGKVNICLERTSGDEHHRTMFGIVFPGSNPVEPVGADPLPGARNFFTGGQTGKGITGVSSFGSVVYHDIYHGIDLRYFFIDDGLKYEFIVRPGGDPSSIRMLYEGISNLEAATPQTLIISTLLGDIEDGGLVAFQGGNVVHAGFIIENGYTVRFELGEYDPDRTLTIDPYLKHSTYLGGAGLEYSLTKPVKDGNGNIFFAGTAESSDFPTTSGVIDTVYSQLESFVVKFSPDMTSLLFSTYLGGGLDDEPRDIAMDSSGDIYVTGYTCSTDFPTTRDAYDTVSSIWTDPDGATYSDAFVSKISPTGDRLIYSTFIGGDGNDGGNCLDVDVNGTVYVGGFTFSEDFPLKDPYQDDYHAGGSLGAFSCDGFVLKLNPGGTDIVYSTYLGGTHNRFENGIDDIFDICIDENGRAIVCGQTGSYDFPITAGAFEEEYVTDMGFVTCLAYNGSVLEFSTFIEESTICRALEIGTGGVIYITGKTESSQFPVSTDAYDPVFDGDYADAFIISLLSDGSDLRDSTFLGGGEYEDSWDLEIDAGGRVVICGETVSTNFPTTPQKMNYPRGEGEEVFVSRFSWDLTRLDMSFMFGGKGFDFPVGLIADPIDEFIISGATDSSDLPVSVDAYDTSLSTGVNGAMDLFLTKFALEGTVPSPPTNLSITDGSGFLILTWDAPENASSDLTTGFIIERSSTGSGFNRIGGTALSRTYFNNSGLNNGDRYYYRVCSENFAGTGGYTDVVSAVPIGLPSQPRDPISFSGDGYNNLSWQEPWDDGGDDSIDYIVYGVSDLGEPHAITDPVSELFFNHTGLENGKTYGYVIRARTERGIGEPSEVISSFPGVAPGPPRNISAVSGDGNIMLSWDPPGTDGGFPKLEYSLYLGSDNETFAVIASGITDTSFTIEELVNGHRYYMRISASNPKGEGQPSEVVSGLPMGAPSAPLSLSVSMMDSMANLKWDPPVDDGGAPWIRYKVMGGEHGMEMSMLAEDIEEPHYRVASLENGVRYSFAVVACNLRGDGPLSEIVEGVPLGPPSKPLDLIAVPGDGSVFLEWSIPEDDGGDPGLMFDIYIGLDPDNLVHDSTTGNTTISISDLQNGAGYYFAVGAFTPTGKGPLSEEAFAIPMGVPSSPVIERTEGGNGSVYIEWAPPDDLGGATNVTYNVYLLSGSTRYDMIGTGIEGTGLYLDGLENGRQYTFRVSAVNIAGEGPLSVEVTATPFTLPSQPLDPALSQVDGKVILTWKQPDDDGGDEVLNFRIYRSVGNGDLEEIGSVDGNIFSFSDTGVSKGLTYRYMITASNHAGEGPGSSILKVKVSDDAEGITIGALVIAGLLVAVFSLAVLGILFLVSRNRRMLMDDPSRGLEEVQESVGLGMNETATDDPVSE